MLLFVFWLVFFFSVVVLSLFSPPTATKKKKEKNARVCVCERKRKKKIPKESKFLFVPKNLDSQSHRNV